MKKLIDLSEMTSNIQSLLLLQTVKTAPGKKGSEVYELLRFNGVENFSLELIVKLLPKLSEDGYLERKDSLYRITLKGEERILILKEEVKKVSSIVEEFTSYVKAIECREPVVLADMYMDCECIKTVPYTIENLEESEDEFFLKTVPNRGYNYRFVGRGLGKGDFSGYMIAFVNNNLVKFIAVLEEYISNAESTEKEMILTRDSIHKLAVPIDEDMIRTFVKSDFKFIRNKQNFTDSGEVRGFKKLLSNVW